MRHYFDFFGKQENNASVEYDNCPIECPENQEKGFDRFRETPCEACPKKLGQENFKRLVTDELFYRFGENNYKFAELLSVFKNVLKCENLPPHKMSVKTFALLDVYNAEKKRWEIMNAPQPPSN